MADHDIFLVLRHFKALGNESRLKLVGLVADRERNVQELAALLALAPLSITTPSYAIPAAFGDHAGNQQAGAKQPEAPDKRPEVATAIDKLEKHVDKHGA